MCTLVILRRPGHAWPLLLAANRDEMLDRAWKPPAAHWADRPGVVGGLDESAGGSWLGVNAEGVVAAVLNRPGALGPAVGKRSRGELVLDALDHADAADAAEALAGLDPAAYRPFNLFVADDRDALVLTHRGDGTIPVSEVPPGLSLLTAHDLNDAAASSRVARYRPLFQQAAVPDVEVGDWAAWEALLADDSSDSGPEGAMRISTGFGFGTSSSALIAIPQAGPGRRPVWRFKSQDGAWENVSPD